MPKRKEPSTEDEISVDVLGLAHKKHKKHKHKKHKKRRGFEDGDDGSGVGSPGTPNENMKLGLKLKIKIGGQTFGETRLAKTEVNDASSDESANIDVDGGLPSEVSLSEIFTTSGSTSKKPKKVDDEEAWLEALEAGRLEEVDDELRRMKDPSLMTARQRSLLESKAQKEKEEAAPAVVEEKVLSEEMIQKKIINAKKRKEQAEEKREKDKKQTIERLLKKSDARVKGTKKTVKKTEIPKVRYVDSVIKGQSLSFPQGYSYPHKVHAVKSPSMVVLCGIKGCVNKKKYSCSKTGIPLCSFECYKKNMNSINAGTPFISVP